MTKQKKRVLSLLACALGVAVCASSFAVAPLHTSAAEIPEYSFTGDFVFDYGYAFGTDSNYTMHHDTISAGTFGADFDLYGDDFAFIYSLEFVNNHITGYYYFTGNINNVGNEYTDVVLKSPCMQFVDVDNTVTNLRTQIRLYGYPYVISENFIKYYSVEQFHVEYNAPEYNRSFVLWIDDDDMEYPYTFTFIDFCRYFEAEYFPIISFEMSRMREYYQAFADTEFTRGKLVGYNEGKSAVSSSASSFMSLFGVVANVPISIFNGLGAFVIWDVPIISIMGTFLIIALFAFVIRMFL